MHRVWRRVAAFLESAVFATVLLVILGVWSAVASIVPQGAPSTQAVAEWALSHAAVEPVVRAIGLHQAFSVPFFIALVVALGVSTALCALRRTRAAAHRSRILRDAARIDATALAQGHDFEVACATTLNASAALSVAADTMGRLGVRTERHDGVLTSVSAWWAVWGSPIFHWALVWLLLTLLVGNMLRSEGLMGVIVGQTKPDAPKSYGVLHAGPLRDWGSVHRSIRVDRLELDYTTGGVDRGPTPTVALLDASGAVIKTQRVYPNMTLKSGPLTIYPSSYGLAVLVSEVDTAGIVVGSGYQLADFSAEDTSATVAVGSVSVLDAAGVSVYNATLTVPLDHLDGTWLRAVPAIPAARVLVTSPEGATVLDKVVRVGETLAVPGSLSLRLDGVTYYARLQIVDDWTVSLLYAGLVTALVGLSIATLARQQIVVMTVLEGPDGAMLVAKVRLWRNSSSSRSEIERELRQALCEPEKESTP